VLHTEFDFRRILFELNKDTNAFQQVSFPDKGIVRDYLQSRGLSSEAEALAALEKWGPNVVEVPAPTFMEMLKEQMIAPFFVFQVGCV
jgi:manganese-transporting P-type ATPase